MDQESFKSRETLPTCGTSAGRPPRSVTRILAYLFAGVASTFVACLLVGAGWLYLDRTGFFTKYADGFSQRQFDRIEIGDNEESVLSKLGPPLRVTKAYEPKRYIWESERLGIVYGEIGEVIEVNDPDGLVRKANISKPSYTVMREHFGDVDKVSPAYDWDEWAYTEYEFGRNHQLRIVVIDPETKEVVRKISDLHVAPWN